MGDRPINKAAWIAGSILWGVVLVPSVLILPLSVMIFDAPGSTSDPGAISTFVLFLIWPIALIVGAVAPWLCRRWSFAPWLFLAPVVYGALAAIAFFIVPFGRHR